MKEKTTRLLLTQETLEKAIKYDILVNALFASVDLSWEKTKLIASTDESLLIGLEPVKYEEKLTELLEREQTKNGSQDKNVDLSETARWFCGHEATAQGGEDD